MTNHTPGPWEVDEDGLSVTRGDRFGYQVIGEANGQDDTITDPPLGEAYANARLIAEAGTVATETGLTPRQLAEQRAELLEALRQVVMDAEDRGVTQASINKALSTIARAEGRE